LPKQNSRSGTQNSQRRNPQSPSTASRIHKKSPQKIFSIAVKNHTEIATKIPLLSYHLLAAFHHSRFTAKMSLPKMFE